MVVRSIKIRSYLLRNRRGDRDETSINRKSKAVLRDLCSGCDNSPLPGFSVGVVSAANTQSEKYAVPQAGPYMTTATQRSRLAQKEKYTAAGIKDTIWSMIIRKNILSDARQLRMIRGQNP